MSVSRADAWTMGVLAVGAVVLVGVVVQMDGLFAVPRAFPDDLPVHPSLAQVRVGTNPGARVHLVEFGDYQCPNSRDQQEDLQRILSEFGDRINFVRFAFPLNIHPDSKRAAVAAACVKRLFPSVFSSFEGLLYANQNHFQEKDLLAYGIQAGVDAGQMEECMKDPAMHAVVQSELDRAVREGVRGTPTLFINGKPFEGIQPYRKLRVIIESLLEAQGEGS